MVRDPEGVLLRLHLELLELVIVEGRYVILHILHLDLVVLLLVCGRQLVQVDMGSI